MYIWKIHLEAIEGAEAATLGRGSRRRLDPREGTENGEVLMYKRHI